MRRTFSTRGQFVQLAAVPRSRIDVGILRFQKLEQHRVMWISHSSNDELNTSWIDNPIEPSRRTRLEIWIHDKASKGDKLIQDFTRNNQDREKSNALK
jgi:hypothetical protein